MRHCWLALLICLPLAARAQTTVPARPAAVFADSIGVNTHLTSKWDTAYGDCPNGEDAGPPPCPPSVARIAAALRLIGVRHIRDGIPAPYVVERFQALAAAVPGLRVNLVMSDDRAGPLREQIGFAAPVATMVELVEGPNEPNNPGFTFRYRGKPFPEGAAEQMRDLRDLLRQSPLSHVPIANTGLGGGPETDADRLGVVPEATFGTAHAYYGVDAPRRFTRGLVPARKMAPGRPMLITETGNCTPPVRTDWCAVSEDVQAKYTLMALADAFEIGVVRTYLYELVDQEPDPGGADIERHFGLFRTDWSPKPAAIALANLRGVLGAGSLSDSYSGALDYSLAGVRTVLLRRNDGAFLIMAWFDADLWDAKGQGAREVAPRPFTLRLGARPQSVMMFDPLDASRRPLGRATEVRLELPDHPVVIEVKTE